MNCPSCGAEVPAGSVTCPICGGPVVAQPGMDYGAPAPAKPEYMDLAPAKKKKTSLVGVIIAVLAVVAVLVVGYFVLGGKYMGTYDLVKVTASGFGVTETYEGDDIKVNGFDMSLKVTLNRCKFQGTGAENFGMSGPYGFKVSGDKVTITASDGKVYGTYDSSSKSITLSISDSGITADFVFQK